LITSAGRSVSDAGRGFSGEPLGKASLSAEKGAGMADRHAGGLTFGGILVIVGIVLAILLGHWWIGLIIALVGLIFFGGFAKGKWY
jgi:hypothetical protein